MRLVTAAHLAEQVELVTPRSRVGHHDHRILVAFLQFAEVLLPAESHVLLVETIISLVIGRQHVAGHRPAVDRVQHPLRLDGHARRRVEFRQANSRKADLAAVAQPARQQDVALRVADGRIEFVFVELAEQPVVDLVLLGGSQAAHAQQMPQLGDPLLLPAVVNLPVGDHVVQFVRQRLRFVPLAGGRHDRYGAEQQQGSQQVCGFQQFHGQGRPPQEGVREHGKCTTFCRMLIFFFNLFYLFYATKAYYTSQIETKRHSGLRFGFRNANLRLPVQGTKNRRNTEQDGQKKRISGDRIAGDPNRRPPEGGAAQGCNPGP